MSAGSFQEYILMPQCNRRHSSVDITLCIIFYFISECTGDTIVLNDSLNHWTIDMITIQNKTASFQKEAMRTQVALYFFYEVKFV